jgi:imidazole glycerol-phosphate synthase subunit HisH
MKFLSMSVIQDLSVTIVDYGLGNIASVSNMVRKVGGRPIVVTDKQNVMSASRLILPGVGSFDHGISQLHELDLFSSLQTKANEGIPLLGICLGMQLLSNASEEGDSIGLGLIDAEFKRFNVKEEPGLRVPHVGWNVVKPSRENPLIATDADEQRFYFTHSYHAVCCNEDDILSNTVYGHTFPSAYSHHNVFGVQFHPEKSHKFGMALMKNFLSIELC